MEENKKVVKKAVKKSTGKSSKKSPVKKPAKKTAAKKTDPVVNVNFEVHYPEKGSSGFTQGVPESCTTSMSMKVSTRPYENIDLFASVTQRLIKDADLDKAFEEGFTMVSSQIRPKIQKIREKFGGEQ